MNEWRWSNTLLTARCEHCEVSPNGPKGPVRACAGCQELSRRCQIQGPGCRGCPRRSSMKPVKRGCCCRSSTDDEQVLTVGGDDEACIPMPVCGGNDGLQLERWKRGILGLSADDAADTVPPGVEVGWMSDGVGKSDGVWNSGDVSTRRVEES